MEFQGFFRTIRQRVSDPNLVLLAAFTDIFHTLSHLFEGDDIAMLVWFFSANDELDGASPRELLRQGRLSFLLRRVKRARRALKRGRARVLKKESTPSRH